MIGAFLLFVSQRGMVDNMLRFQYELQRFIILLDDICMFGFGSVCCFLVSAGMGICVYCFISRPDRTKFEFLQIYTYITQAHFLIKLKARKPRQQNLDSEKLCFY